LWVWATVLLGYTLGRTVPNIEKGIHYIIAAVILVSLMPAAFHAWKARQQKPAAPLRPPEPEQE
jgi:membrane protein DedA with SNARE-associated domain